MTPGARLQASIDILSDIERTRHPADRVFDGWSRSNRYAGSKDRAAISEMVYGVLRNRAVLSHAMKGDTPRLMVFGVLKLLDEKPVSEIDDLCTGENHTPEHLSDEETDALTAAALPGADAPVWIRNNYPEWMHDELLAAFGSDLEREMWALQGRAPTDLRVNVLKAMPDETIALLAEEAVAVEPAPLAPFGLRMLGKANLPALTAYRDGLIEIQDEGSQLACLLAAVKPGEQVLDLCAGGGGKTLALAAQMANKGQIYACDRDGRRLDKLMPRAQRAGARNVQTMTLAPWHEGEEEPTLADLAGRMDCVLVDAPCSGTGAWRRSPDARWRITPEMLATYHAAQTEVLARAAPLVKPGGRLVYITCSLLPSENEQQVSAFLERQSDFSQTHWQNFWPAGLSQPNVPQGQALRLTPARTGTDGFYIAVLQRNNGK
ncbi:MAG: methyltransferase domain-containing protein [Rhizobiales bacterium]|nr:methyltransferase domain-containing protein [Hyphomicrobiales bacterium]